MLVELKAAYNSVLNACPVELVRGIYIYIYIKVEDVAIYLPFGMYGNIFCMTRGSLVG